MLTRATAAPAKAHTLAARPAPHAVPSVAPPGLLALHGANAIVAGPPALMASAVAASTVPAAAPGGAASPAVPATATAAADVRQRVNGMLASWDKYY